MASISSIGGAFGYTNAVLAYDDTLPAAPPSSTPTSAPAAVPAVALPTPASVMPTATTAQKIDLGNLALEGQMASALFGVAPTAVDPSSVFFGGGTTAGLFNPQAAAAQSYVTPPAAPPVGGLVDATA